jgi:4'-phosphopantetheinyl transferase
VVAPLAWWLAQGFADVPADDAWLAPGEGGESGTPKRRAERRLRRWTAKRALALHLGLPAAPAALARLQIRHDPRGAPWPLLDGRAIATALSLTDRAGRAVCALGPPGAALGCDLERVEPRSAAFVGDYLTAAEQRFVGAARGEQQHVRANLVWCAKEAALKALGTGLGRDTRSVTVEVPRAGARARWRPLAVTASEGARFEGWWRRDEDFLLAVVGERLPSPPSPLGPDAVDRAD